jgi:hypothetical protein
MVDKGILGLPASSALSVGQIPYLTASSFHALIPCRPDNTAIVIHSNYFEKTKNIWSYKLNPF